MCTLVDCDWRRSHLPARSGECCNWGHAGRLCDCYFPDPRELRCGGTPDAPQVQRAKARAGGKAAGGRMKVLMKISCWSITISLMLLAGCKVGPNYKRPPVDTPSIYRADQQAGSNQPSLGNEKWWTVFQDDQLQQLIRTALKENYDVRIAAARVLEAQAVLGITRADQLPTL